MPENKVELILKLDFIFRWNLLKGKWYLLLLELRWKQILKEESEITLKDIKCQHLLNCILQLIQKMTNYINVRTKRERQFRCIAFPDQGSENKTLYCWSWADIFSWLQRSTCLLFWAASNTYAALLITSSGTPTRTRLFLLENFKTVWSWGKIRVS